MSDEVYVHVAAEEEWLNDNTYPQPRIITYGVVHTETFQVDGCDVANLYSYPIKNRITKYVCVPMPNYIYDVSKIVWERTRDLMPGAVRDILPNHCSEHFYCGFLNVVNIAMSQQNGNKNCMMRIS
jgi:hypothetical protein